MRFLSYILLILVSIQVMMPCMDGICDDGENVELSDAFDGSDQKDGHDDESGHADHCSPFCTCSCCHSDYLSKAGQFTIAADFPVEKLVQPASQVFSSFHDLIWQPPKA